MKGLHWVLRTLGITPSVAHKILAICLYVSLVPILAVGVITVDDASRLGDGIVADSRETKDETIDYLNLTLNQRQEEFYGNLTREKAEEYSDIFQGVAIKTRILASYARFVMESNELNIPPQELMSVWLSPPYPNYNQTHPEGWFYEPQQLEPFQQEINEGQVVLALLRHITEEDPIVHTGYFAVGERITLYHPPHLPNNQRMMKSDVYIPQSSWYQAAVAADGPVWTDPVVGEISETVTMTSSMAVRAENGSLLGVVGLNVFLEDFRKDVLSTENDFNGTAFVVNETRHVLVAPWISYRAISETGAFPTTQGLGDLRFDKATLEMANMSTGYRLVTKDNESQYLSFAPIPGANMSLGILLSLDEVQDDVNSVNDVIEKNLEDSEESVGEEEGERVTKLILVTFFLMCLVLGVSYYFSKKLTEPIITLKEGADLVGKGDLEHRVKVRTGDELQQLAVSFNHMASYLNTQMVVVEETAKARARIERDLQIAQEIQKGFLPVEAPSHEGYTMAGINLPAWEVGGDFYDYIEFEDGRLGIVIADVSGKGVPAALFTGICKTLLRAHAKQLVDPAQTLKAVNASIIEESDSGMFVTIFYAILDPVNHTLTYVNAGHNPPLLMNRKDHSMFQLKAKGMPVGIMDDIELEARKIALGENEILFLYTDGVTEAVNTKDEEFGTGRLQTILRRERDKPAEEIMDIMVKEIKDFAGSKEQFDDITMVVVRSRNPLGDHSLGLDNVGR